MITCALPKPSISLLDGSSTSAVAQALESDKIVCDAVNPTESSATLVTATVVLHANLPPLWYYILILGRCGITF